MDEFEKEYFARLNQLAALYQDKRRDLAKSRIKMFTASLYRQLVEEGEKFDLLVASGNSGLFMVEIAKMVFDQLELKLPQKVVLPIYRFDDEKHSILADNSSLKDLPSNANVLFVDDEIMAAITVKKSLELILAAFPQINTIRCLIIAENHFFEWHYKLPKVSINFFAFSRLIQGLNGNIGYFLPEDLYLKLSPLITDIKSYNQAMAVVVGGALKRKKNGSPFLTPRFKLFA